MPRGQTPGRRTDRPPMTPEDRLAQELLATADALRNAAAQLLFLEEANHPAVNGQPQAGAVRAHARTVAEALEALAARLARELPRDPPGR